MKHDIASSPIRKRRKGRWKKLCDRIENMDIGTWIELKIDPMTTDTHFRIAIYNIGKFLNCRMSVHKVALGEYKVGKFEKGEPW